MNRSIWRRLPYSKHTMRRSSFWGSKARRYPSWSRKPKLMEVQTKDFSTYWTSGRKPTRRFSIAQPRTTGKTRTTTSFLCWRQRSKKWTRRRRRSLKKRNNSKRKRISKYHLKQSIHQSRRMRRRWEDTWKNSRGRRRSSSKRCMRRNSQEERQRREKSA